MNDRDDTNPAHHVFRFGETLIWPLQIVTSPVPGETPALSLERWTKTVTSDNTWIETCDSVKRKPSTSGDLAYSEYHYFLPHVQRFLYPGKGVGSFRILKRSDSKYLQSASVVLKRGDASIEFTCVCRELLLYVFDTGVLILKLTLEGKGVNLDVLQLFRETFRRAWAPFLPKDASDNTHFPLSVTWNFSAGKSRKFMGLHGDCSWSPTQARVPHMPGHWKDLLAPLEYMPITDSAAGKSPSLGYAHLGYEQIPTLSFVSVASPARICRGNQIRLAFSQKLDPPGTGLPYASGFLRAFESRNCYDRFYDPALSEHKWMQTRFFVCPYAFTIICDNSNFSTNDLFNNYLHHYSQLALLAHLQKATLMHFRNRLYHSSLDPASDGAHGGAERVLEDLLTFTNSCRFLEVSTQEQGQDLYRLLLEHLEIEPLYAQLLQHSRAIADAIRARRSRTLEISTLRLTVVATFGLALALTLGFWGMNIIGSDGFPWIPALTPRDSVLPPAERLWMVVPATVLLSLFIVYIVALRWRFLATRFLGIRKIPRDPG